MTGCVPLCMEYDSKKNEDLECREEELDSPLKFTPAPFLSEML